MASTTAKRVQKRREALRDAGLRPLQIWVPDTRRPGFADECLRQSGVVAEADRRDEVLTTLLDAALDDLDPSRP